MIQKADITRPLMCRIWKCQPTFSGLEKRKTGNCEMIKNNEALEKVRKYVGWTNKAAKFKTTDRLKATKIKEVWKT